MVLRTTPSHRRKAGPPTSSFGVLLGRPHSSSRCISGLLRGQQGRNLGRVPLHTLQVGRVAFLVELAAGLLPALGFAGPGPSILSARHGWPVWKCHLASTAEECRLQFRFRSQSRLVPVLLYCYYCCYCLSDAFASNGTHMNIHLSITAANVCCVLASWRLSAFKSRPHTELISSTDTDSALLCIVVVCKFYSVLGSFYCTAARLTLFVLLPLSFSLLLKRSCLIAWSTRLRLPAASATFSALLSACHKTTAIYHLFCIFSQLKMISMHFAFQILLQETRP